MTNEEKAHRICETMTSIFGVDIAQEAHIYSAALEVMKWKDEQFKDKTDVLEGQIAALEAHLKKAQEALVAMWDKNQLLNQQPITEQGGWHTEPPTFDCFALLMTPDFPKNCHFVVAEWDNDAKCFYSESFDFPIEKWDYWKLIQKNWVLENPKYSEEVERIKERNGL